MNATMIATARYVCGPYTFMAWLPRIGTSEDKPQWSVEIDGHRLLETYPSLQAAMGRAIQEPRPPETSAPADDQPTKGDNR